MGKFLDRLKKHAEQSVAKVQSETVDATVLDVIAAPSVFKEGNELKKVRIVTKEYGSLWAFENNVVNRLSSYGSGVPAKITIVNNEFERDGVKQEGFNTQRVVIQAADHTIEGKIKAMPAGTALFALA